MNRIFGLDVLRALAIMLVLLAHSLSYIYTGDWSFFNLFFLGYFGVEIFFILSGFLIGRILISIFNGENDVPKNIIVFWIRRWLRTLPLYYVCLLVYILGNTIVDKQGWQPYYWKYFFFVQNFFNRPPRFFGVSWSLSIEEWFYILFPLLVFGLGYGFRKYKKAFIISLVIFLTGSLLLRYIAFPKYEINFYEGFRKITIFRLDAIAYGVLLAWLESNYRSILQRFKWIFFGIGIVLLYVTMSVILNNYQNLEYFNTLFFSLIGISLSLLFLPLIYWKTTHSWWSTSISYISKISYSLYLVHWFIIRIVDKIGNNFSGSMRFFIFILLSLLLASLTYHFIEKPFMKLRKNFRFFQTFV